MSDTTTQTVLFPTLISKPIVAAFDQAHSSTDGGGLLLKAIDERIGLSEKLASCLRDGREPGKIRHEIQDLFRQRMFAIALGHPDCNDAQVLAADPIHKMMVGRTPISGDPLASQSTLSRFENAVGPGELYRLVETIAEAVINRHRRRLGRKAKTIILDFDPTDDPTHGQQEFAFYHGHYGTHCFLPLIGTIAFNREKRQSLLCAVLRPGDAGAALGFIPILDRLLAKIRVAFPKARIRLRLERGFAVPSVLDYLDEADVEYVVGLSNWPALKKKANNAQRLALREYKRTGQTTQIFGETQYQRKKTWPHPRRVLFKAEVGGLSGAGPTAESSLPGHESQDDGEARLPVLLRAQQPSDRLQSDPLHVAETPAGSPFVPSRPPLHDDDSEIQYLPSVKVRAHQSLRQSRGGSIGGEVRSEAAGNGRREEKGRGEISESG